MPQAIAILVLTYTSFQRWCYVLSHTAVSSEAWAKLRDWANVAGRGRLLLSGSVAHVSLETAVESIDIINLLNRIAPPVYNPQKEVESGDTKISCQEC